jgi:hypothetical protein
LFPSFLLSNFYTISNFHFPLMKLHEDYYYVWFPNLIHVQFCAVKFWIMASSALYDWYSYAQRDWK